MGFRKLRIAWSVCWGITFLLFLVLWANSNISVDYFTLPISQTTNLELLSFPNEFAIGLDESRITEEPWHTQTSADEFHQQYWRKEGSPWSAESSFFTKDGIVFMPYWFGVLLSAAMTIAGLSLELKWHFTIRFLLLATTLVAVALGLAVYAARR